MGPEFRRYSGWFLVVILIMIGFVIGAVIASPSDSDIKLIIEAREMLAECERELPRNQHCSIIAVEE